MDGLLSLHAGAAATQRAGLPYATV